MLITLLKDLEMNGSTIPAGQVIDVTPERYNWLMSVYMDDRKKQVEREQSAALVLERIKDKINDNT